MDNKSAIKDKNQPQPQQQQKHQHQKQAFIQHVLPNLINPSAKNTTFSEQMSQLLSSIFENGQKTYIYPQNITNISQKTSQQIQIYTVRDTSKISKYRIAKKRQGTKSRNKQKENLLFQVQSGLCLNTIILAMVNRQKVWIGFGANRQVINRQQTRNTKNTIKQQIDNIQLYQQTQKYLHNKTEQTIRQYPNNRHHINNNKNVKISPFCKLQQLKIDINNQSMCIEEWISSIVIVSHIMKVISRQHMIGLEKLEVNIHDDKGFYGLVKGERNILQKINDIYSSLRQILKSKIIQNQQQYTKSARQQQQMECYFPKLDHISFNPMFYLTQTSLHQKERHNQINQGQQVDNQERVQKNQQNKQKQQQMQQCETQYSQPIRTVILVDLTSKINQIQTLNKLLTNIFPYFSKAAHISFKMRKNQLFTPFNQLLLQLYKYCPYIQSLHIKKNQQKIPKQLGLRSVLQNYPFLSDLNIALWPRLRQINQQPAQLEQNFTNQWKYIKDINFRRLHIQRMVNMIKILEKRGYNQSQCIDILQFMRPLKFHKIFS